MWSDPQFPWWPQFFQKQVFSSVPFLVYFNCAIISKFPPLFSVRWLGSANHTVCLQFLFSPVVGSILGIAVLLPPQLVSIVQPFSKPPPWVLVCKSCHSVRSGSFVFETLVGTPPLKTPLAPSYACFNHSIILESILLTPPLVISCKSAHANQSGAWALEKTHTRLSFFLYFLGPKSPDSLSLAMTHLKH